MYLNLVNKVSIGSLKMRFFFCVVQFYFFNVSEPLLYLYNVLSGILAFHETAPLFSASYNLVSYDHVFTSGLFPFF